MHNGIYTKEHKKYINIAGIYTFIYFFKRLRAYLCSVWCLIDGTTMDGRAVCVYFRLL